MSEIGEIVWLDLLAGTFIVVAILVRSWFTRIGVPSLVGFLVLGFLLRLANDHWSFLSQQGFLGIDFLASIGVFVLLFRVGLESDLQGLLKKLPQATPIWIGNVVLSGIPAYLVSFYLLDLANIPSLFIAAALTATSVAVSAEVWREANALGSANGETFVDVAELDDLSGVALMALLLGVAPVLRNGDDAASLAAVAMASIILMLKAGGFVALLYLVARYGEHYISRTLKKTGAPDSILFIAGVGLLISALASVFGFSMAIGGFFAGVIFGRDPDAVKLETSFLPLHALFAPFFFIAIGLRIDPGSLASALSLGGVLLVVAILGKVIGAGWPALMTTGYAGAALIGISMVPRAEIAMVIAQQGSDLGEWAMPAEVFSSLAMISVVTCILSPLGIRWIIAKFPQSLE
ncbi:MAG: cation:proton antiporter [Rhodospirillaceae bacterium]|jgi:Kef-type K+ transport system membrane component KefB|nr:cation:proton antiporter [Rhodospirillaceae bacterium]MBT4044720.1 cation:proton antiporter [Rhodospirillaceae bacterium]MBT4687982.1 cation:proton antiporter [Rhodospirillaceae bacterium]MBT5083504.1 cation:proton antiporter [Rhodospirillaceae bacterium]MBT5527225.1 cation:proton antiporter [Rhodospirillaceae bacterium]